MPVEAAPLRVAVVGLGRAGRARVRAAGTLEGVELAGVVTRGSAPGARSLDEVLLALPGSYSHDQLGLILGIARACGLPVRGLVDAAVAASATRGATGERRIHLDLELHRAVVTELGEQQRPAAKGSLVAWEDCRACEGGTNLEWDIYMKDLSTWAGEQQVSSDPGFELAPEGFEEGG